MHSSQDQKASFRGLDLRGGVLAGHPCWKGSLMQFGCSLCHGDMTNSNTARMVAERATVLILQTHSLLPACVRITHE